MQTENSFRLPLTREPSAKQTEEEIFHIKTAVSYETVAFL